MTTYAEEGCPFTYMGKNCPDPYHKHTQVSDLATDSLSAPQTPSNPPNGRPTDNKAGDILIEFSGHVGKGDSREYIEGLTEAKASLYQDTLDLIGVDEENNLVMPADTDPKLTTRRFTIRNELRAELREAFRKYYGQGG